MILHITKVHIRYAMQKFCKAFISLCNGRTELVAVHIKIIEQSGKAAFRRRSLCRAFNVVEYTLQGFVQVFIVVGSEIDIAKQLGRKNKKALFFYQAITSFFCIGIGHFGIIKIGIASFLLTRIDVVGQVLGDIAIKHGSENIVLKIPAVNGTTKFISDCPYRTMQLVTLLFFLCINHGFPSPFRSV